MKLEDRFPNKRVFITGAASGLGLTIAEYFATRGWKLLIADINAGRLEHAADSLQHKGAEIVAKVIDVTNHLELEVAAKLAVDTWGGIDMVFNNAGIASAGVMEDISLGEWKRTMNTDLWSVIYGCRAFIPMLKQQGSGYIINTASSAGTLAVAEMANYNVAKAGVVSLSETLRMELSPYNIGVTVVCPTVFKTGLGDSLKSKQGMEMKLLKRLEESTVTSEEIVADMIRKMERRRLYVMTQSDAVWGWRIKRYFPELSTKIFSYLYRNKKWVFAD